jgi:hypothetical protein
MVAGQGRVIHKQQQKMALARIIFILLLSGTYWALPEFCRAKIARCAPAKCRRGLWAICG